MYKRQLQLDPSPGPNPFTPLAIRFWENGIDADGVNSHKIAAVGSSDSHNAGRADNPVTQSPIGQATTVVFADELSERGIQRGVEAGHTYVKMWGNDGPDLRLEATTPGSGGPPAIIGDTIQADAVKFTAAVRNLDEASAARPGVYTLSVVRNGLPFLTVPIPPGQDVFQFEFPALGAARYRLQVDRTASGAASVEAVSSPIYVEAAGGPQSPSPPASPPEAPADDGAGSGPCVNTIRGTSGADGLTGTEGGDRISGRGGPDRIKGGGGDDCLRGGRGADRAGGGPGDDRINVKGGGLDRVRCGPGHDRVRAGRGDRLRGCERVR